MRSLPFFIFLPGRFSAVLHRTGELLESFLKMPVRADLHVASRYTQRTDEWVFRHLGLAASYSEPWMLYDRLKSAGMDLVTITDENTLDGVKEIADRPDVFLSELAVAHFPDSKAKIKILIWGLNEAQHEEIARRRENLFALQAYLREEALAHAVAHPFYSYNRDLTLTDLERLILLFKHFEGINGHRASLYSEVASCALERLTPEIIERLSDKHHLTPTHPEPWKKIFVGGSADRGGQFVAQAFTECPGNRLSPREFLGAIQRGECVARGEGGNPLRLAHGFFNTLFSYARRRFAQSQAMPGIDLLDRAFSRFLSGENPTEFGLMDRITFVLESILSGKFLELALKPSNAAFFGEVIDVLQDEDLDEEIRKATADVPAVERRAFAIANVLFNRLYSHFTEKCVEQIEEGNGLEGLRTFSALLPAAAFLAPYFYGFQSQAPNRKWLTDVAQQICGEIPPVLSRVKRAWFTDTVDDVNGVAMTVRRMALAAYKSGAELELLVSRPALKPMDFPVTNFLPRGQFEIPEYERQIVTFPPILEMIDYVREHDFSEIIISTPGPVGLTGLLTAKMLGLRSIAIYHTDIPQYARIFSDDHFTESVTWKFMHWFFDSTDLIYNNSEHYRQQWAHRNIIPAKLKILPRGLDTDRFHPSKGRPDFFAPTGVSPDAVKLLYVGRISVEKDLDVIVRAHDTLTGRNDLPPWNLIFIGEGPYLDELRRKLPKAVFAGALHGEDLATAYASADIFLFPSTTDTFGNVVIEAQASGLPTIVSDLGGPKDLVEEGVNGYITPALNDRAFAVAMARLIGDPALREKMGRKARQGVEHRSWDNAFAKFWELSEF